MRNEELIVSHMDYARGVAANIRREQALHFEAADLESEAIFGLMKAGERFNPALGVPFRAMVNIRIAGQIKDFLSYRNQTPFHELLDVHTTESGMDEAIGRMQLRRVLAFLPKRWRQLLVMRFWLGFTQKEAADKLGVGIDRAWQMQRQALARMRGILEAHV